MLDPLDRADDAVLLRVPVRDHDRAARRALLVAGQLTERLGQREQHRRAPVRVDRAEAPRVVVRAQDEPLVGELAATDRADHVRRPREPLGLVDPHAHREVRAAGQAVFEVHRGGPAGRHAGARHARQDFGRRLVADRQHGYGVQGDLGRVEALHLLVAVDGQGGDEGGERVAGPREREDGAALDRLPAHHGALGVGAESRETGVVEHDDAQRAALLGELDLVAAEVPAVARDHDLPRY